MPAPLGKCEGRSAAFAFRCFPKRIDIPVGLRNRPLVAYHTSRRLADVFRRSDVHVLGDLQGRKVADFAFRKNCGFNTLHELDSLVRRVGEERASHRKAATAASFSIPESVCKLRFDELPITRRLANVVQSMGARTLGDLNGRTASELLRCKNCYWRTVAEIQQLIERAIAGEFDVERIEESKAEAELLTLLEQGMAKLSRREKQFLLARIRGLTFAEIGWRFGLTRARVHQVVVKALDTLRKTWGPRVPRLLEMLKRQEQRRSV